jgi:hypothetical protein
MMEMSLNYAFGSWWLNSQAETMACAIGEMRIRRPFAMMGIDPAKSRIETDVLAVGLMWYMGSEMIKEDASRYINGEPE